MCSMCVRFFRYRNRTPTWNDLLFVQNRFLEREQAVNFFKWKKLFRIKKKVGITNSWSRVKWLRCCWMMNNSSWNAWWFRRFFVCTFGIKFLSWRIHPFERAREPFRRSSKRMESLESVRLRLTWAATLCILTSFGSRESSQRTLCLPCKALQFADWMVDCATAFEMRFTSLKLRPSSRFRAFFVLNRVPFSSLLFAKQYKKRPHNFQFKP